MLKYFHFFLSLHFISFPNARLKSRRYLRSWNRGVRKTAAAVTLSRRRPVEAVTVTGQHPPPLPPPSPQPYHLRLLPPPPPPPSSATASRGSQPRATAVTAITTPKRAAARMWPANSMPWTGPTRRRRNGSCGKMPPRCPSRTIITVSSSSSNRLVQSRPLISTV